MRRPRAPLPRHCPSGSFRDDSSSGLEALVLLTSFVVSDKVPGIWQKYLQDIFCRIFKRIQLRLTRPCPLQQNALVAEVFAASSAEIFQAEVQASSLRNFVYPALPSSIVVNFQGFTADFADVFEVTKLRRSSLRCQLSSII